MHGFIFLNEWEKQAIDSAVFQRLHYIHQLGVAYLVYPGATHSRFEHSLGVMHIATQIYNRLLQKHVDLQNEEDFVSYWRQIVRMAALCHDLGHLPFSHVAEKAILGTEGHEKWTLQMIQSSHLLPLWEQLQKQYPDECVLEDIVKVSIGEEKLRQISALWKEIPFSPWERVMSAVITGDFFGADRIDYLLRDARCTGASYGLFDYHQLIEMLCILPDKKAGPDELTLGIEENGLESCEAMLLARHFMYKRVYQYPSVKGYSFHMSRFMQALYAERGYLASSDSYLSVSDSEVLVEMRKALQDPHYLGHQDALALQGKDFRFHVLELPKDVSSDLLMQMQQDLGLTTKEIQWHIAQKKEEEQNFSFPVLKKNDSIVDARQCSEIPIPSFSRNWVYIDPLHSGILQKKLEDHLHSTQGERS